MDTSRKFVLPIALAGLAVASLIGARSCLYVTPPGKATVIFNSIRGLQRDQIKEPGVIVITPFVDLPVTYDMRTKVWQFTNEPSVNQAGAAITVNSADGQAFSIDVYIALRPNEATLDDLHAEIGENYMDTVVVPVARSKIRDISAEFDSEDFYRQDRRTEIEERASELIREEMPAAVDDPETPLIIIEGVFLGTPNFPDALKESIERKQVASITAQTAAVRAEIQAKETERLLILAEADQEAIELQGQAAAINAQLADLLFYERLQERIRQAQQAGRTPPLRVIRMENEQSTVFLNVEPQQAAASQGGTQ